jgi:hypothetical protein
MSDHQHEGRDRQEYVPGYSRGSSGSSPGKRTLTQSLVPRPIIYRVASDPRDGNNVAVGADAAVDRASASAGTALRPDVRERFESSLGADLAGVRVHTGAESADAASSVGARAYTVGNDIHFGAGQYQPDDPFGLHLLAHEVAHTQQQAGGTPHRQNKLEVSAPGDAAEHEADRAADAMVAGQAVAVGSARGGVARDAAPPAQSLSKSFKKGPVEIEIAMGNDDKVSVSASLSITKQIATPIPGVFFEVQVGGKATGEGQAGKNGSVTIGATLELNGQGTLNGGIPEVASIYGGGAIAIKWPGLTVTRSASGEWDATVGKTLSLTCKAVIGAKADITDQLPPPWQGLKYEINPGGEQELAVLDLTTGNITMGKDLKRLVGAIKQQLVDVGLMDAPAQQASKGVAGVDTEAIKKAGEQQQKKKALEEKRRKDQAAARSKKQAADSKQYDQEHNPAYANNSHAPIEGEELRECDENNYTESTNQSSAP